MSEPLQTRTVKLYLNPDYVAKRPHYIEYRDTYEGDQEVMKQSEYLWFHELEMTPDGKGIRRVREQRSAYVNHVETLISQWTSLIFKEDPEIPKSVRDLLGDNINDIDGRRTSLLSFIRSDIAKNSFLYGRPILYVGAYGSAPATLAQEKDENFRPYWEIIEPLTFVDWQEETRDPARLNELNFVRVEYEELLPRSSAEEQPFLQKVSKQYFLTVDPEDKSGRVSLCIRTYKPSGDDKQAAHKTGMGRIKSSAERAMMSETSWDIVSEIILEDWSEIPIVAELHGESWVRDIVPHVLKYYNTESVVDNIVLFQAYQRNYICTDSPDSLQIKNSGEYVNTIVAADTRVHTIEPTSTESIEKRLGNILNTLYRIGLNQVRMMSADSRAVQSDDTIKEERESVMALVRSELESIENIVNHGIKLYAKYLGYEGELEPIKFNASVTDEDIDKFVRQRMSFLDETRNLAELRKAELRKYIRSLKAPNEEEIISEMEKYIDESANKEEVKDPLNDLSDAIKKGLEDKEEETKDGDSSGD